MKALLIKGVVSLALFVAVGPAGNGIRLRSDETFPIFLNQVTA